MINESRTERLGPGGIEHNFYVSEDLPDNAVLIECPQVGDGINLADFECELIKNPFPIIVHLHYINSLITRIYGSLPKNNHGGFMPASIICEQYVGTQTLIHLLNKVFCLFMFEIEKVYISRTKIDNYIHITSIHQLLKDNNYSGLAAILFKSDTSRELFGIVHDLNNIYLSQNGTVTMNTLGVKVPVITGATAVNGMSFSYIYHNHSLPQIIAGVNKFLHEVNFYRRETS